MRQTPKASPTQSAAFRRAAVPELLFDGDLGLVLGMSAEEAGRFALREGIPHVDICGRLAVRREALFAWLATREGGPRDPAPSAGAAS